MENKQVNLDDKKEKSAFLKSIEKPNNILKHLFETVYIDSKGDCYNMDSTIKQYQGRCVCETNLNEVFDIEEDCLFCLNTKEYARCLKGGKTKILSYEIKNNDFIIITTEENFIIGKYLDNKKLDMQYLRDIMNDISVSKDMNYLVEKFNNKEFVIVEDNDYPMTLTHRLCPGFNKSTDFSIDIHDNNPETFYGVFVNKIEERNKKDEIIFEMKVRYFYRFLKL